MSQSFSVNDKEYLPSNSLALSAGYTSDYIGKLAREEKILGTRIGRQWFIEPSSLELYLHKAKIEKEILKEELSSKRKIERAGHESNTVQQAAQPQASILALAQAVVILSCGLFVGGLSWIASVEEISPSEFVQGAYANSSSIVATIGGFWSGNTTALTPRLFVAATTDGIAQMNNEPLLATNSVFTVLPLFPQRDTRFAQNATSSSVNESLPQHEFSDEVRVITDQTGTTYIQPVFKNQASGTARYILLPVKEKEN